MQTRSNSRTPVTAVFSWGKKLQDGKATQHHAARSAALCTHCIAESRSFSIATSYLKANLETENQLKNKTKHGSIYYLYFKPQLRSTQGGVCSAWGSIFMESSSLPSHPHPSTDPWCEAHCTHMHVPWPHITPVPHTQAKYMQPELTSCCRKVLTPPSPSQRVQEESYCLSLQKKINYNLSVQ